MGQTDNATEVRTRSRHKEFLPVHSTSRLVDIRTRYERCEAVLDMVHEAGDDPLLLLWRIAQDAEVDIGRRIECAKEVASYMHSKSSTVKVQGDKDNPVRLTVCWEGDDPAPAPASCKPVIVINGPDDGE